MEFTSEKSSRERLDMIGKLLSPRLEYMWATRKLRDKMCKAKIFNANNLFGEWMLLLFFFSCRKKRDWVGKFVDWTDIKRSITFFPSSSSFISLNFKMAFTLQNGQFCFYVCFNQVSRHANEEEKRRKK